MTDFFSFNFPSPFFNPVCQTYIYVSSYWLPETPLQEKQSEHPPAPTCHAQHSRLRAIRVNLDLMPVDSKEVLYDS